MLVQLGIQKPLRQRFLQLSDKTALREQILRTQGSQKLVQSFLLDRRVMLLFIPSLRPHTQDS